MRYLGGKHRLKNDLVTVIRNTTQHNTLLEPFMGGGSMTTEFVKVFEKVIASDNHEDLMLMWKALCKESWVPPASFSEADYQKIRQEESSALRALVGFGCSFGGKWFGGYARAITTERDFYAEAVRGTLVKKDLLLSGKAELLLECKDFSTIKSDDVVNTAIYCDPPYENTTKYSEVFDSAAFWEKCNEWVIGGADVFVSELSAPPDWKCIWEKPYSRGLRTSKNESKKAVEKLFFKTQK